MNEAFYRSSPNWCRDTPWSSVFHPGQRCYREIPAGSTAAGDQVCFDNCGNVEHSPDRVSPVEGRNPDGTCNFSVARSIGHTFADVIPSFFKPAAMHTTVYINRRPVAAEWLGTSSPEMAMEAFDGELGAARYSAGQLQQLWLTAGGDPAKAVIMAAIALAESSGNPAAINPGVGAGGKPTNEYSVGLWQINTLVHKKFTVAQLKDPATNAGEAVRIYKMQGLRAWGAYTDRRYLKYMPASQSASPQPVDDPPPGSGSPSTLATIGTGTAMIGVLALLLLLD